MVILTKTRVFNPQICLMCSEEDRWDDGGGRGGRQDANGQEEERTSEIREVNKSGWTIAKVDEKKWIKRGEMAKVIDKWTKRWKMRAQVNIRESTGS